VARSNTANGGTSYFDLEIQTVSIDNNQYTLRAAVFLYSLPVTDNVNNFVVSGNWSRSGSVGLSGSYSGQAIWYQDISFARGGSDYTVNVSASIASVEYWGVTLSASTSYLISAQPPTGGVPFQVGVGADSVTATTAHVFGTFSSDPSNGSVIDFVEYSVGGVGNLTGGWNGVTFTGLRPVTDYDAYSRAHNGYGYGPWSAPFRFVTGANTPGVPAGVGATAITSSSVTMVWNTVTDTGGSPITGYQMQLALDSNFTNVVHDSTANNTSRPVSGLSRTTRYFTRVRAINAIGPSGWSAVGGFDTLPSVPGPPTITSITAVTPTSASVAWSPPVDNGGQTITAYDVQYSLDPTFATGSVTQPTGTLTGLTPGATYSVRVRAKNGSGPGEWSAVATFTTQTGMKVYNGTAWIDAPVYAWNGTSWVACEVRIFNGTAWVPTG
jgi:fibronectin type III domain protein